MTSSWHNSMSPASTTRRMRLLDLADKGAVPLTFVTILIVLICMTVRIVTRHPFYDERMHVHYLYLISCGCVPYRDFWCAYAIPGYVFTLPLFSLLPQSMLAVLVLRIFVMSATITTGIIYVLHSRRVSGSWVLGTVIVAILVTVPQLGRYLAEYSVDHFAAVAAATALAVYFMPATWRTVALAAFFSVLSFLIAPKYPFVLTLGGLGLFVSACTSKRAALHAVVAAAAAGLAAVAVIVGLHALAGASFRDALYWVYVIQSRYNLTQHRPQLGPIVAFFLLRHKVLAVLLVLGVVGWLCACTRAGWRQWLAPTGVVSGVICSLFVRQFGEQYLFSCLLALAFFAPFMACLAGHAAVRRMLPTAVVLVACGMCIRHLNFAAHDLDETPVNTRDDRSPWHDVVFGVPGVMRFCALNQLLESVPTSEPIVGVWNNHLLFRRDLTYITQDDRPSLATIIPPDNPVRRYFDPAYFRAALYRTPPAYIDPDFLWHNYPPGWAEVCRDFVNSTNLYAVIRVFGEEVLLRRDLLLDETSGTR